MEGRSTLEFAQIIGILSPVSDNSSREANGDPSHSRPAPVCRNPRVQHGAGAEGGSHRPYGEGPDKGLDPLVSLLGVVLIAVGFGRYRAAGYIPVWDPPTWTRHLALLLVWFAFVSVAAAYLPGRIKARLKHPMLTGVKIWALAHLLANGDLGSILLFGAILVWAVLARISAKRRDEGPPHGAPAARPAGSSQ